MSRKKEVLVLLVGEAGGDQSGDDVAGGRPALLGGQGVGVVEHVGEGRPGTRVDGPALGVAHGVLRILEADDPVGPVEEQLAVLGRHPQHLGQGEDGEVGGQVGGEVARPLGRHPLHRRPGPGPDALGQGVDVAGGEGPGHQAPQPGVFGRVEVEHHAALELEVVRLGVADLGGAQVGGEQPRAAVDVDHVGVAGHGPVARPLGPAQHGPLLHPHHRAFPPEPGEDVVGDPLQVGGGVEEVDHSPATGEPWWSTIHHRPPR